MSSSQIRSSRQIRQDFLDFFKSKQHTIVPSSSLMPDSPGLLFTNAGMNQFVPIFLNERKPDVSKWPGAVPGLDTRAADTQKCIRAGGKHNDLEDVGLDTYHHTFFEMLGNWSFGDYFKKEAIDWAWELVTEVWKFPKNRLYATVYSPDKSKGDPAEFDQEAHDFWAEKFRAAGLDPKVHIVNGNKKDNFWMMGDTGPCGPCSELHVDLTPEGNTRGSLVNKGDARCIEIWNLVFIQFNANPDGTFSPLPAKHVDTGMGFERVTSIIQGTNNFSDFAGAKISNYETDIFRPIFDELEKLSGKKYGSTLPKPGSAGDTEQEKIDVAFRVIADHIRTLSFAIADGIQPGNTDRNYVLRRILRRAVRYGRTLGFHEPFFYKLVDVLADTMGDVFPEIREKRKHVQEVIRTEEVAFNRTLDRGISIFEAIAEECRMFSNQPSGLSLLLKQAGEKDQTTFSAIQGIRYFVQTADECRKKGALLPFSELELRNVIRALRAIRNSDIDNHAGAWPAIRDELRALISQYLDEINREDDEQKKYLIEDFAEYRGFVESLIPISSSGHFENVLQRSNQRQSVISAEKVFELYDTYGFPLDLTELMARERGLTVDVAGFEKLMEEQRERARKAQKKTIITVAEEGLQLQPTKFLGYDLFETEAVVEAVLPGQKPNEFNLVLDRTPCYAEMGGQVGDAGVLHVPGPDWSEVGRLTVLDTQRQGEAHVHRAVLAEGRAPEVGEGVRVSVDGARRGAIQRHHTVTHLFHWALHEVASRDASQKGSYVGPDKLTFDFNSQPLTPAQIRDIEKLVNERILENAPVSWTEVAYSDVKARKDVMQFFGEKYGDHVRVVQIGGRPGELNGYSMELCGGTHTRATGEIGLFRIVSESAIAAGVRRVEAVAGLQAYQKTRQEQELLGTVAGKVNAPVAELEKKVEALLAQQKEMEKQIKAMRQSQASDIAKGLVARAETVGSVRAIIHNLGEADGDFLQAVADSLKGQFQGVVVLGGVSGGAVSLVATVSPDLTKQVQAGKIIQAIAPIVGGKGGGRPDNARGGGRDAGKLNEALEKVRTLL